MDSPYKLPSTSLSLAGTVHSLIRKKITLNEIGRFRHAYILNSLIGMRPVVTIGETAFVPDEASCAPVTAVVLGEK
jgi:4-amino-4-deoxychorismate lyase